MLKLKQILTKYIIGSLRTRVKTSREVWFLLVVFLWTLFGATSEACPNLTLLVSVPHGDLPGYLPGTCRAPVIPGHQ